jgi:hypothetical protein
MEKMFVITVDDLSGGFISNIARNPRVKFIVGDVKDAEFLEDYSKNINFHMFIAKQHMPLKVFLTLFVHTIIQIILLVQLRSLTQLLKEILTVSFLL